MDSSPPQPPPSKLPMWARRTIWAVTMTVCITTIALAIFTTDLVEEETAWGAGFIGVLLLISVRKLRY